MVDHPLTFTFDEAPRDAAGSAVRDPCPASATSSRHLVGNALWTGVRLKGRAAGSGRPGGRDADRGPLGGRLHGRVPDVVAMGRRSESDDRGGMNREPLPANHGFPARLIVPGSTATSRRRSGSRKDPADDPRAGRRLLGASAGQGRPILTQSRIDLPATGASFPPACPGRRRGVGTRPRGRRSLRSDRRGPWQNAAISRRSEGHLGPMGCCVDGHGRGQHSLEVEAIDGTGVVQNRPGHQSRPGRRRGHHRITVSVT